MSDVFALITTYQDELLLRTAEHIFYTFAAVLCASMVGVSLGVCAFFYPRSKGAIIAFANIMQTIPSLAMLALLFVLIGQIGVWPVLISLVLYALLPIVRGTLSGLESISPALVEAARGLGLTPGQQLRMVRLPLASPHIISGIRVAMNFCVGIATIATFIGGGALGQFISRGLSKSETDLILLGAIPAALLALVLDALIAGLQRAFWHKGKPSGAPRWLKTLAVLLPLGVFVAGSAIMFAPRFETAARSDVITISSKNFTESRLLAEILAQTIEANTPYQVDRKPGLQGTLILHESLLKGEIDAYVEYTGTSYSAIMKRTLGDEARAPEAIYLAVKDYYDEAELVALPPLGFNNTYVFVMKPERAAELGIQGLRDLLPNASTLDAAFDYEFAEREDGYRGLRNHYGMRFAQVRDMHSHLMYEVLHKGQVDVISGYATDGRIKAYGLQTLQDDLHFFPPYDAFVAVRKAALAQHDGLEAVLRELSGRLDNATMRRLNFEVDFNKRDVADVAAEWLSAQ